MFKKENTIVNILGTDYKILYKDYKEDKEFERSACAGYCNIMTKTIVVCNPGTNNHDIKYSNSEQIAYYKETLRHELVHAFLYESGISDESHSSES